MVILCVHFTLLQAMAEEKKKSIHICVEWKDEKKKKPFQNN